MRVDAPRPVAQPLMRSTAAITLAGRTLATGIPLVAGRIAHEVDRPVPELLACTLPRTHQGVDLTPAGVLRADGHRIEVTTHLVEAGRPWNVRHSPLLVTDVDATDTQADVTLTAAGLLTHIKERLEAREVEFAAQTAAVSEIMRLVRDAGLEVVVHESVPVTRVPAGFVIGGSRWEALQELATAIPARIRQDQHGAIHVLPPLGSDLTPTHTWSDGHGGATVRTATSVSREDLFNHFIVHWSRTETQWEPDDEGVPQSSEVKVGGTAEHYVTTGRLDVDIFGVKSREIESDAITNHGQAQSVAMAEANRAHLRAQRLRITGPADFRAQLDDPVGVALPDRPTRVGRYTGIDLPLTTADGEAAYDVGVPA